MSAAKKFYLGTGRRKTSVARVRICEGSGKIVINKRELTDFFPILQDQGYVVGPLLLLDMRNRLDVFVNVAGGGHTGQAGATLQGVARALKTMFGATETPTTNADGTESTEDGMSKKLRDSGFLTRDSRMKERKKYGRKGARRSFQFSKR
ncbi:30S ribosomal protein S9 [Zavarzinella formosa]|uniref:30S ribosomal protein S9 n=1 Tax=Zavarzinella formosa TaxID=360055 RepID=UPI000374DF11|nr:30S ribosomal protein S9 [Zavarzinella formosa]